METPTALLQKSQIRLLLQHLHWKAVGSRFTVVIEHSEIHDLTIPGVDVHRLRWDCWANFCGDHWLWSVQSLASCMWLNIHMLIL